MPTATVSAAEYCAFLDERCRIFDEHWLEKFILLFEKHARLCIQRFLNEQYVLIL